MLSGHATVHVDSLEGAGHDQELFAAPTHQVISLAEHRLQTAAHLHQDGIAGGMAVRVVDGLEVVDVDQEKDQVGVVGQQRAALPQVVVMAQRERHIALDLLG